MTITQNPPAATPRTASDIEAELASIDTAAHEQALAAVPEAAAAPKAPAPPADDLEYEARRKGWRPEAEYTGAAGKWVDAKTFLDRGERFTKKLEGEIAELKRKVDSFEGTKAQFRQFFDEQMAKRDREHAEAVRNLRLQRAEAVRDGDDELVLELEDRIDATKERQATFKAEAAAEAKAAEPKPAVATPPADAGPMEPLLQEWIADGNDWFRSDEALTKHAIAIGNHMREQGVKLLGRAFLDRVAEQVRADFPRRFKAAEAAAPRNNPTEGGGQGGTGAPSQAAYNGKTERDLPPEDLAMMRQFVKDGLYTKEAFLKSYFSRNGK